MAHSRIYHGNVPAKVIEINLTDKQRTSDGHGGMREWRGRGKC